MVGFTPPVAGIHDAPNTTIALNVEWRSFIVGALERLLTPPVFGVGQDVYISHADAVWSGDDDDQFLADNEVQKLISALANDQGLVMIPAGTINPYIGTAAPDGWLKCDGTQYNQADYPTLTAVLPAVLKSGVVFNVPDMRGRMPVGVNSPGAMFPLASTGGEHEHILTSSEMPSHTHTQNAHTHTQNSHNHTQDAHNHSQSPHTHTQNSHNHTQDAHNHTSPAHAHNVAVDLSAPGFGTLYPATGSGAVFDDYRSSEAVAVTINNTTATNQAATATNQNTTASNTPSTATNQAATATNQNTTATNQNTGGDTAHNNMPPYFAVNYIIKT